MVQEKVKGEGMSGRVHAPSRTNINTGMKQWCGIKGWDELIHGKGECQKNTDHKKKV